MRLLIIPILASFLLGGCAATGEYKMYTDSQIKIETARYAAEAAKYKAMADIAATSTEAAKVAAVMALALNNNGNSGQPAAQLRPPEAPGSQLFQWTGLLLPSLIQGYGIHANTQLGMKQSDNAAVIAQSTNSTFLGMAKTIQAPQANVTTTTNTTTTTLSGTGVIGSGSNKSVGGNGVLGSGMYSLTDNHAVTNTTNTTTTTTDNHAVSTVDNHSVGPVTTTTVGPKTTTTTTDNHSVGPVTTSTVTAPVSNTSTVTAPVTTTTDNHSTSTGAVTTTTSPTTVTTTTTNPTKVCVADPAANPPVVCN